MINRAVPHLYPATRGSLWLPPQIWLPLFYGSVTVLTNFCVPRGPRFGGAAGRGPPWHAKIDFCSLPAQTITKIFSNRVLCLHGPLRKYFRSVCFCFCPRGPLRNIFDYGEATIGCTGDSHHPESIHGYLAFAAHP